jgi:uncharacterized protein YjiS (DUF1127 family)
MEVSMSKMIAFDVPQAGSSAHHWLAEHVRHWLRRRHYRAELRELLIMGPHFIADFGMTVAEAEQEANLPFWRSSLVPPLRPL